MATPPTFVAVVEPTSNWKYTSSASPSVSTPSFDVAANDRLIVFGLAADGEITIGAASGGSLTYSSFADLGTAGKTGRGTGWTATVDSSKTMTVTVSCVTGGGVGTLWGFIVYQFRDSDGFGSRTSTNNSTNSGAPSLSITSCGANSALAYASMDWNANDGATRTWRTINSITPSAANGLEKEYFRDASFYTVYSAYWNDDGSSGAQTVGLSSPATQRFTILAVEVLGSTTSSGSSGVTPVISEQDFLIGIQFAGGRRGRFGAPMMPSQNGFSLNSHSNM